MGKFPKTPEYKFWYTLCIDLIGPYEIGQGKNKTQLHCLTMIDPATGWFEIAEIPNKSRLHCKHTGNQLADQIPMADRNSHGQR